MKWIRIILGGLLTAAALGSEFGCSQESADARRSGVPIVTRARELNGMIGKRITVVGTARESDFDEAFIALRDVRVDLPAYHWPEGYVDQSVSVIGTLIDHPSKSPPVYRVGEIEIVEHWSR